MTTIRQQHQQQEQQYPEIRVPVWVTLRDADPRDLDADATPRALPAAPPPGATVIFNETDRNGFTTVIIHKQIAGDDLGIRLRQVPYAGLVLDDFPSDAGSILLSTNLHPTMNILSINGCDCSGSGMDIPEAMQIICSTVGELTIKAWVWFQVDFLSCIGCLTSAQLTDGTKELRHPQLTGVLPPG